MPHDLDVSTFHEARDARRLNVIAIKVAAFVDGLEADFDKLDDARDMIRTAYPIRTRARSAWRRDDLIKAVAEALSDHLLNEEGAHAFAEAVREGLG